MARAELLGAVALGRLLALTTGSAQAAPGDLDSSFGSGKPGVAPEVGGG